MEASDSYHTRSSLNGDFGFGASDRRFAFSRQASLKQTQEPYSPVSFPPNNSRRPFLSRTDSSIDIPRGHYWSGQDHYFSDDKSPEKVFWSSFIFFVFRNIKSGHRYMKRLFFMISLNVAYSTAELLIGLFTGRVGLVSDAFHLTFGCGLLTFSLFVMAASRKKADGDYTYGAFNYGLVHLVAFAIVLRNHSLMSRPRYKRLEVLSAFTNTLFLLFMSFSLAVEALHAFIQDESEHKHYLIVSAVTNLVVNLIGVWFFRNYARINLTYRNAEDMNHHSVFLHVLADSIRSAGLILASWLLSVGVQNAEVLCLGLVSGVVFTLVLPLFRTTGGILLQMAPPSIPTSALSKCLRQITAREDVLEVSQARFWELVPGHVVGSLSIQVKKGVDDRPLLGVVHGLYHDLGVQDLTVQTDDT